MNLAIGAKLTFNFFFADIHVTPITTRQFIYEVGQLRLRGDVIIRCYQLTTTNERAYQNTLHQEKRELIFSVQFHTCAITNREVSFYRNDLDFACDGKFWQIFKAGFY